MGKIKKFAEHSALSDTSWSVGKEKVTLRQLLKFMKENDITSKWIPISKLEKLLIKTKSLHVLNQGRSWFGIKVLQL
jgi:hypothetical protein